MLRRKFEEILNVGELMDNKILVRVLMLAFGEPGESRYVEVPLKEICEIVKQYGFGDEAFYRDVCRLTYYWGQNDHQQQPHPSVSVGDVIVLSDERDLPLYYLVCAYGFSKMTVEEFLAYKKLDRRDRTFSALVRNA